MEQLLVLHIDGYRGEQEQTWARTLYPLGLALSRDVSYTSEATNCCHVANRTINTASLHVRIGRRVKLDVELQIFQRVAKELVL